MTRFKLLFACFMLFSVMVKAQLRDIDLSLYIITPTNNFEVPYGDTSDVVIGVKNNGTDTFFTTDTIFVGIIGMPVVSIITNTVLAPGDSVTKPVISGSAAPGQLEDDTTYLCLRLLASSGYEDGNPDNDEACVTVIFKGANSVGIGSAPLVSDLNVYPNPTDGLLKVEQLRGGEHILVTDMLGSVLSQQQARGASAVTVDLSRYDAGIYLVQVRSDKGELLGTYKIQKL